MVGQGEALGTQGGGCGPLGDGVSSPMGGPGLFRCCPDNGQGQALTLRNFLLPFLLFLFSPSLLVRLSEGSCPEFTNLLGTTRSPALQRPLAWARRSL